MKLTSEGKSINDFSHKVSSTILKYVKDEDALCEITQVLDEMGNEAWKEGYEEGYDDAEKDYNKNIDEVDLEELQSGEKEYTIDLTSICIKADGQQEAYEKAKKYIESGLFYPEIADVLPESNSWIAKLVLDGKVIDETSVDAFNQLEAIDTAEELFEEFGYDLSKYTIEVEEEKE